MREAAEGTGECEGPQSGGAAVVDDEGAQMWSKQREVREFEALEYGQLQVLCSIQTCLKGFLSPYRTVLLTGSGTTGTNEV